MISDFNFKLNNVGLINNTDINLSKINVIVEIILQKNQYLVKSYTPF